MKHRCTCGLVAAMLCLPPVMPPSPEQLSIRAAVEAYQAGEWRRALDGFDTQRVPAGQLTSELDAWTAEAEAASQPRRRVVAAAFALDAVWTATRTPANYAFFLNSRGGVSRTQPLDANSSRGFVVTWAARQIPPGGTVTTAERALWLAAIGIAEDGGAWQSLLAEILPLARKQLPDDARLRLATVLARTSIDLGPLRNRSFLFRSDVLREEKLSSSVTKRIPSAIQSLEALLTDASLAGEVELRIGYLELRRRNWPAALGRFDAARGKTTDQMLVATADYMTGWVHEQNGQLDEALAAYRRALVPFPTMRNLATQLSALLFLRGDRTEAYAILDRALNARPIPLDLMLSLERGDGRFVEDWLSVIRQLLPRMAGS